MPTGTVVGLVRKDHLEMKKWSSKIAVINRMPAGTVVELVGKDHLEVKKWSLKSSWSLVNGAFVEKIELKKEKKEKRLPLEWKQRLYVLKRAHETVCPGR